MYKLLIADDETEIRNGLFHYFPWNEAGFEAVGQAENGLKALEFIRQNPVDIVLCDIMMPQMTGLELAERLHRDYPAIKVCFFTAYKDFAFAQKAITLGAVQYVLKSSTSADLLSDFRAVKEGMDAQRARDARKDAPAAQSGAAPLPDMREAAGTSAEEDRVIAEIKRHVRAHYATADLDDIARTIYMSPNYISKVFKKKTGQNFSEFLLQVKMEKAAELLCDFRYKIYDVSEQVGYKHVKNFSRSFKDYYGVSPRDYRGGKPPKQPCGTEASSL